MSLVLAADARAYVSGLTAYREGRSGERIDLFARAIERAADRSTDLAATLAELQAAWRERSGKPRRHSSVEPLIVALTAHPILTLATRQKLLGRSKQAVNTAIAVLAGSGALRPLTLARRNRAWEARESCSTWWMTSRGNSRYPPAGDPRNLPRADGNAVRDFALRIPCRESHLHSSGFWPFGL